MINRDALLSKLKRPFAAFVIVPFVCFAFYQLIWATPRYESQTQLIVQQPNGGTTLDPTMALLAGFSGGTGTSDTELVRMYIHSNDMLVHLQQQMNLDEHFSSSNIDIFNRLSSSDSQEDKLEYFKKRVHIDIDDKSSVIIVRAQGYEPAFTQQLGQAIADRAEWYINKIGNDLAQAQLEFIHKEQEIIEQKLETAKLELLAFQRQFNLLDPDAEGMALQQIANQLEAQIAVKQAELNGLLASMSESAPQVILTRQQIEGLQSQLDNERRRMTMIDSSEMGGTGSPNGVNELAAKFTEYKVNLELALQAYTASQVSMEKSRMEAYRQLKYLVMVEAPLLPEEAKYPQVLYNLVLFFIVNLMVFGIAKIIIATVEELK